MKIRMISTASGPDGVLLAGGVYEVDASLGDAFVAGGYALRLDKPDQDAAKATSKKKKDAPNDLKTSNSASGGTDNAGGGQDPSTGGS